MLSNDQIKNNIYRDEKVKGKSSILEKEYKKLLNHLLELNKNNILDTIDFLWICDKYPHYYYKSYGKK